MGSRYNIGPAISLKYISEKKSGIYSSGTITVSTALHVEFLTWLDIILVNAVVAEENECNTGVAIPSDESIIILLKALAAAHTANRR